MTRHIKPPFTPHPLHHAERHWPETNCYVDLWIELLASRGHEPLAGLGFTVRQDFEGDQFTFFKVPADDLERLFGVTIQELAIFDTVEGHAAAQLARGTVPLIEMDGFYLPDTDGVSYRLQHTKTTVAITTLDPARRRMSYFHNAGFFAVAGEDYDGLFGKLPGQGRAETLFPYAEFARFGAPRLARPLAEEALHLLRHHLDYRPRANPVAAYQQAFPQHAEWLERKGADFFHAYAFNTLRQLGANFELLASHLAWLGKEKALDFDEEIASANALFGGAKAFQFQLARAVARGRLAGLEAQLTPLVSAYDATFAGLRAKVLRALR